MYLKRVTITGFKSFAIRTVIEFGPGISAVVGPNGSGKSNVADAIRWCLGEQGKAKLRTADREEVIFAGSEGRAKASFCEVALVFDNESGRFGIELAEIEFVRRLYRSGESYYRLAGKPVTMREAQALMSDAGFGAGTYAVIGQGMIDSLLLSSPSERKQLFDEAAGIRGPEMRRDGALRQLSATEDNIARLRGIAAELEPRLRELERAIEAGRRADRLREALAGARLDYAERARFELEADRATTLKAAHVASLRLHRARHDVRLAQAALRQQLVRAEALARRREEAAGKVATVEQERDRLTVELADRRLRDEARLAAADQTASMKRDLAAAQRGLEASRRRLHKLTRELERNGESVVRADAAVRTADQAVAAAQNELIELRDSLSDEAVLQYVDHALRLVKTMAVSIDGGSDTAALRLLVHKAGRLLSHASRSGAAEVAARIGAAQAALESAMTHRDTAIEHQANVTISGRSLELDARQESAESERLTAAIAELERAVGKAYDHLAVQGGEPDRALLEAQLEEATGRLAALRHEVTAPPESANGAARRAATVERLAAERATLLSGLKAAGERLSQIKALESALVTRIADWGIKNTVRWDNEPANEPLDVLERRLIRLEAELAAHDGQHSADLNEYTAIKNRHQLLTEQITDLEAAGADLNEVVVRLDGLIKERFEQNFERLSQQFGDCYSELFGGGTARLELTEGADRGYGVNISISPKGRRFVGLAALSGGERALAGVALLTAILYTSPAPFVILDEVDAALDDANSGRLSEALRRLSTHTQLIAITHNRQTMAAAQVLYGVTMDGRHTSQVLTLQLDEAVDMAAR